MWFYAEYGSRDNVHAACFVEAQAQAIAHFKIMWEGHLEHINRMIPLPGLTDQVPSRFLERRLELHDLRDLDFYLGGDGTGTAPVDERKLPWL